MDRLDQNLRSVLVSPGRHLVASGGRIRDDLVERREQRELEEHGRHLQVDRHSVQHFDDAVVRLLAVLLVKLQQPTVGLQYGGRRKSGRR